MTQYITVSIGSEHEPWGSGLLQFYPPLDIWIKGKKKKKSRDPITYK